MFEVFQIEVRVSSEYSGGSPLGKQWFKGLHQVIVKIWDDTQFHDWWSSDEKFN